MSGITIRRFEPQDQKQVEQLISSIMDAEFHDVKHAYPLDDVRDIQANYGLLGEAFFVAVNSHGIIGTAGIKKEDDRAAFLRRLFVSTTHRKQNVGKKLVERVLGFCGEVGYEEIIFKATSKMDAAVRLLQRSGFAVRTKVPVGELELLKLSHLLPAGARKLKS